MEIDKDTQELINPSNIVITDSNRIITNPFLNEVLKENEEIGYSPKGNKNSEFEKKNTIENHINEGEEIPSYKNLIKTAKSLRRQILRSKRNKSIKNGKKPRKNNLLSAPGFRMCTFYKSNQRRKITTRNNDKYLYSRKRKEQTHIPMKSLTTSRRAQTMYRHFRNYSFRQSILEEGEKQRDTFTKNFRASHSLNESRKGFKSKIIEIRGEKGKLRATSTGIIDKPKLKIVGGKGVQLGKRVNRKKKRMIVAPYVKKNPIIQWVEWNYQKGLAFR